MKIPSLQLLEQLHNITEQSTHKAEHYLQLSNEQLNYKKQPESWSILECIEHLNLYGEYYLPEIEQKMNASGKTAVPEFKSGILGNYFANAMKGKNGVITKMKSPKDKVPLPSGLNKNTIERFLIQQKTLKKLLLEAKNKDLNSIKTNISISKLISIKLGDTFRFFIYHIDRHILQAERNLLE